MYRVNSYDKLTQFFLITVPLSKRPTTTYLSICLRTASKVCSQRTEAVNNISTALATISVPAVDDGSTSNCVIGEYPQMHIKLVYMYI
jgi:hypothetical protein